jgi:hypothetical protein
MIFFTLYMAYSVYNILVRCRVFDNTHKKGVQVFFGFQKKTKIRVTQPLPLLFFHLNFKLYHPRPLLKFYNVLIFHIK